MSDRSVATSLPAFSPAVATKPAARPLTMRVRQIRNKQMNRCCLSGLLAGVVAFAGIAHAVGQPACRPTLAFKEVAFSAMEPPSMQRKWTAVVAVDASGCAANATGRFEIVFTRLQEFGPDSEAREEFAWTAPAVTVAMDFAPTEAVERYRIGKITPCVCAAD
jgi:hypothetical protein